MFKYNLVFVVFNYTSYFKNIRRSFISNNIFKQIYYIGINVEYFDISKMSSANYSLKNANLKYKFFFQFTISNNNFYTACFPGSIVVFSFCNRYFV